MLYIACAIYPEAAPFIRQFSCKRDSSFAHEQVFVGEEAVVIITGASPVTAAISLTEALTLMPPAETDLLANVGLCGCADPAIAAGTLYLVHSILEHSSGRRFFPDLLYRTGLATAPVVTYSTVVERREDIPPGSLADTEAAGLYQAGLPFFSANRMFFFKIVSDHADDAAGISPEAAGDFVARRSAEVVQTLLRVSSNLPGSFRFSDEEEAVIGRFCRSLQCSVTMEHELRRLIVYYELERGHAIDHILDFMKEQGLCRENDTSLPRKEGKHVLEVFRRSCLS